MSTSEMPIDRAGYEHVVESLLEQLNMGRSFSELFDSIYDQLVGIVPYNRIGVALLEEPERVLRLTSCRSDGELMMKVGYAAPHHQRFAVLSGEQAHVRIDRTDRSRRNAFEPHVAFGGRRTPDRRGVLF